MSRGGERYRGERGEVSRGGERGEGRGERYRGERGEVSRGEGRGERGEGRGERGEGRGERGEWRAERGEMGGKDEDAGRREARREKIKSISKGDGTLHSLGVSTGYNKNPSPLRHLMSVLVMFSWDCSGYASCRFFSLHS